jgi:hypothetical protein
MKLRLGKDLGRFFRRFFNLLSLSLPFSFGGLRFFRLKIVSIFIIFSTF